MNPAPYLTLCLFGLGAVSGLAAIYLVDFCARRIIDTPPAKPRYGRRVCAWCKPQRDLGTAHGLPAGKVTHTCCPECAKLFCDGASSGAGARRTVKRSAEARTVALRIQPL